jgi:hypothetical protein
MAGQEATFFETIRTALLAVNITTGPNVKAFPRVWVQPYLDLEALMKEPRWPTAVIIDNGWKIDRSNGKVKRGLFSVVIVLAKPRDPVGDASVLSIMDYTDVTITALEYESTNSIHSESAGGADYTTLEGGVLLVARALDFSYELRRA